MHHGFHGWHGYGDGFWREMVRMLSVKSVRSVVMWVGFPVVEIALQELNSRSDARTCLEVLLNAPWMPRMARIRGWFLKGNGSHVIR